MANKFIVTNAGLQELADAVTAGTAVKLTQVKLGNGKYIASADQIAMRGSVLQTLSAISGGNVGDNVIHLEILDDSDKSYSASEIGVFSSSGVLFGVVSGSSAIIEKAAGSNAILAIDFVLASDVSQSISVDGVTYHVPPATTEVQGIVELATAGETVAGDDAFRAVTPAGLKALTATYSRKGLVELASPAETVVGESNDMAVTPLGVRSVVPPSVGASSANNINPVFVNNGVVKAVTATAGSTVTPVFVDKGVIKACSYSLNKTVPSDAVFTDTVTTLAVSGNGNAITGLSVSNGALTAIKENLLKSLSVTGTGNAITAISENSGAVTATKGTTFVDGVSTSGSGNAVTSISKSGSSVTATKGKTFIEDVSTSGSGNAVTSVSVSGSSVVLTKGTSFLSSSGGTVTGTLVLSKTTDLSGTANNSPALIVGGTATQQHMELDSNEIQSKTSGTAAGNLYLQPDGGTLYYGANEVVARASRQNGRTGYYVLKDGKVFAWKYNTGVGRKFTVTKPISFTTEIAIISDAGEDSSSIDHQKWISPLSTSTTDTFYSDSGDEANLVFWIGYK